jgi:hypothetical protein
VREGARQAVVANVGDDATCTLVGVTASDATKKAMCLTKERIGLNASAARVKILFSGSNQIGDALLVCAQYPMSSATGVFKTLMTGRTLTSKVQMRIETVDLNLASAAESPLPGKDWSWCA